jgi:signal peptidase II
VRDWRKIGAFASITAAVVVIDHIAKILLEKFLGGGVGYSFLADTVHVESVFNTGAILGLGSQLPEGIRMWVMPALTLVVLIWVSILLIREREFNLAYVGLSLVWAGGFSNLVDRIAFGKVYDFFNIGIGAVRTGTSNLADLAIMAGILLLTIGWLLPKQVKVEAGIEN